MISVIIPIMGGNRQKNLASCLHFLRKQQYTDIEVILVEQIGCRLGSFDAKKPLYKHAHVDKYITVEDKKNRKFNQPWMSNVGAKISSGEILLFYDVDLVVAPTYIKTVVEFDKPFFFAWNKIFHLTEDVSNKIRNNKNLMRDPNATVYIPGRKTYAGYSVAIDRNFFFNKLGGYSENYLGWGGNDNDISARAFHLLRSEYKCPHNIYHLWHPRSYAKASVANRKKVFATRRHPQKVIDRLLKIRIGNPNHPTFIPMEDLINDKR